MKTAIVILNWNTREYLERFLPPLLQSAGCAPDGQPLGETEVVVADNGSSDGSVALLAQQFPGIRVLAFDRNLGFTGGYNEALSRLTGYRYFVLLNSDIEVPQGWLEPLVAWMDSHPRCAACAPKIRSWKERRQFEYAGAAGGMLDRYGYPFCRGRILQQIENDEGQYDQGPKNVFWVSGACMMVRSDAFDGLDPRFFAHMEEIDLCWRLQLAGYQVTAVPDAVVYHIGGGTLPNNSPRKLQLNYRNNLLMLSNNLAKTRALEAYRKGVPADRAARQGRRSAAVTIFIRMMMDGGSALVYLLSGKAAWLRPVVQAHREFRQQRQDPSVGEIRRFLTNCPEETRVEGLYGHWIILRALLKGKRIFKLIHRL